MTHALLVTGAGGMLGSEVVRQAQRERHFPFARGLGRADLDVTDPFAVRDVLHEWVRVVRSDSPFHAPVVVNCAAYTAVDQAETDEDAAYAVNAAAPALLATVCAEAGAQLLHVSTDYVFDGTSATPYEPTDQTAPQTAYGRTKLQGERSLLSLHPKGSWIVRTSWLYGGDHTHFVRTMVSLEQSRETVSVVDDQIGSPTWSADLAGGLLELARSGSPAGILHASNAGEVNWYGFARAVFEELGADPARVQPTTTAAFPRPARRPSYSVLSQQAWRAAGLTPLRGWRVALTEAFQQEGALYR